MQPLQRGLAYATLSLALTTTGLVQAADRDLDNDGRWDFNRRADRDIDNDGRWGFGAGGTDRDADNDGRWDHDKGGSDRDLDNDKRWDYDQGGFGSGSGQRWMVG